MTATAVPLPPTGAQTVTVTALGVRKPDRTISVRVLVLAAAVVCIWGSALPEARPAVFGLSLHPFLWGMVVLLPIALGRLALVPRAIGMTASVYFGLVSLSTLADNGIPTELVKLSTTWMVVLTVALLVRNQRELTWVAMALVLAVAGMAVRGLVLQPAHTVSGINILEGISNKNGYSLYALPSLLIAGYLFVYARLWFVWRAVLLACSLAIVAALFASANRSGWLGAGVVALMVLSWRLSPKSVIMVAVAGWLAYFVVVEGFAKEMFEHRVEQTRRGYESDDLRVELAVTCFEIAASDPILGVGPKNLPNALATRMRMNALDAVDPHNVFGYVVGSSGFFALLCLLGLGAAFLVTSRNAADKSARSLLRMLIFLFAFRGMFTREVLYSPAFAVAIGLAWSQVLPHAARAAGGRVVRRMQVRVPLPSRVAEAAE